MMLKAGLIVAVFMHMAWERLALVYAILVPPVLVLVFVAIMASNRTTRSSPASTSSAPGPEAKRARRSAPQPSEHEARPRALSVLAGAPGAASSLDTVRT